jgi:hypothetical protein
VLAEEFTVLKSRRAHGDAEGFGFGTTRHRTAIVTRQDHYGTAFQVWPEQAFARHKKVIAVDKRK